MIPDWLLNWATISVAIISIVYVYLTWNDNYWKERKISFLKPKLLFGNYTDVLLSRKTVGELMQEIYTKLDGKAFVGFWRFRTPGLLIRDVEVIKSVLMKEFNNFDENGFGLDPELDPLLSKNPFFRTGEPWKNTRTLLTPSFTSGKLKTLLPLMEEVSDELVAYLRSAAPASKPDGLEAKEVTFKYTVEMVARCAFGINGDSFNNSDSKIKSMARRILVPGFWKNIEFMIINFLPVLGSILRVSWMPKDVDKFFRKIMQDVIDYRQNNNITRKDYLQYLIDLKRKAMETGKNYTDEDVMGNAITLMTEGTETSSISLSFALYQLAMNPELQESLRQKVAAARLEAGGQLTFEALMEMPLLEHVLQETLRLHVPLMAMEKLCSRDTVLRGPDGSECPVKKGTLVIIPVRALHRDARFFPDPERFDPGRWEHSRSADVNKDAYMPFGGGPRLCIGMRFAQMQVKLAIVKVIEHFDVKTTPRTPKRIVQDPTYFLACSKDGLWLHFEQRKAVS